MIALPLFLQMTLEYNAMQAGLSLAPLSLSMFGMAMLAGQEGRQAAPGPHRAGRVRARHRRDGRDHPPGAQEWTRAGTWSSRCSSPAPGWACWCPSSTTSRSPPSRRTASARPPASTPPPGSFGLSFGLAMAGGIMLWALALSFTNMTESSTVIPPAQQQQIADALETDAEVMSNTQLQQQIVDEPPGRPGRDPHHQHRRPEPLPPVRAPRPRPRRPPRPRQLVPHAAAPRHHPGRADRRRRLRLTTPVCRRSLGRVERRFVVPTPVS